MSTPAQLVSRIRREWLEPPEQQPIRFLLNGNITSGATSLVYEDTILLPEEAELLGPSTLIEIDYDGTNDAEQVIIGAVNTTTNTLSSLIRGVNGTTAAAHLDNTEIRISPTWTRQVILDALYDSITQLWPDLYRRQTSAAITIANDGSYNEAPSDAEAADYFLARIGGTGSNTYVEVPARFHRFFPPSSTTRAFYAQVSGGTVGYLVYRSKFARPTSQSTNLSTIGIETEWEQIVLIGAVAYLIGQRDLDPATAKLLTQQLEAQNFPVPSGGNIRTTLLRYHKYLLERHKAALSTRDGIRVSRGGWVS